MSRPGPAPSFRRRTFFARIVIVTISCAQVSAASAQRLGQGPSSEIGVWRVVLALAICLTLAAVAAVLLRRRLGGSPTPSGARRLQVVEVVRVSHQVDV